MDTTVRDPLTGRVLDDRYEVESRIARGGMATIYAALDRRLHRRVALKVMHPHLADDDEFVARFVREARSAAALSHPNVVQVFDQGNDGDVLYLAMELLPGRTLRDVIAERGALTPREALAVLEPMLDALDSAHRAGLVHRDVKPENVILTDDGRVKVADFGLARAIRGGHTQTGMLVGTVAYLAPELVTRGLADARSDVYAAGIVLFEMLTGRQPFTGEVPMQVAYRHVHEEVPRLSALVPTLPSELDDLATSAVARDPDDRPADAGDWLAAVRRVRAVLDDDVLDARPQVVPAQPAAPAAGSATELVAPAARPNPTQTLPQLNGLRSLRERRQREAMEDEGDVLELPDDVEDVDDAGEVDDGPQADGAVALRGGDKATDHGMRDDLRRMAAGRRLRGLVGLVMVLLLTFALAGGAWYLVSGPGAFTATPQLVNLSEGEARALLTANGLEIRVEQGDYSDTVPEGEIMRTRPESGERIRKNGAVSVYLSLGPSQSGVPKLVGMTREEAERALEKAGLKVGAVSERNHDTVAEGQVIGSVPGAGKELRLGSSVDLVISQGPGETQVPDVRGRWLDEARQALADAGLTVTVTEAANPDFETDRVLEQDPDPGQTVRRGSEVRLVVAADVETTEVPDVVGWTMDDAEEHLEDLGFEVDTRGGRLFDTVQRQSPDGGSQAAQGSTVVIAGF